MIRNAFDMKPRCDGGANEKRATFRFCILCGCAAVAVRLGNETVRRATRASLDAIRTLNSAASRMMHEGGKKEGRKACTRLLFPVTQSVLVRSTARAPGSLRRYGSQ